MVVVRPATSTTMNVDTSKLLLRLMTTEVTLAETFAIISAAALLYAVAIVVDAGVVEDTPAPPVIPKIRMAFPAAVDGIVQVTVVLKFAVWPQTVGV